MLALQTLSLVLCSILYARGLPEWRGGGCNMLPALGFPLGVTNRPQSSRQEEGRRVESGRLFLSFFRIGRIKTCVSKAHCFEPQGK